MDSRTGASTRTMQELAFSRVQCARLAIATRIAALSFSHKCFPFLFESRELKDYVERNNQEDHVEQLAQLHFQLSERFFGIPLPGAVDPGPVLLFDDQLRIYLESFPKTEWGDLHYTNVHAAACWVDDLSIWCRTSGDDVFKDVQYLRLMIAHVQYDQNRRDGEWPGYIRSRVLMHFRSREDEGAPVDHLCALRSALYAILCALLLPPEGVSDEMVILRILTANPMRSCLNNFMAFVNARRPDLGASCAEVVVQFTPFVDRVRHSAQPYDAVKSVVTAAGQFFLSLISAQNTQEVLRGCLHTLFIHAYFQYVKTTIREGNTA